MDYSPEILRNKGVPVQFHTVTKGDNDWEPVYGPDGPESQILYIRFTHNIIADLEERYDGIMNWQSAMEDKPVSTLRSTLAIMLVEESADKVGAMFIEGRLPEYNNAIGVAWALANGVDPEIAGQLLEQAMIATDSQIEIINGELVRASEALVELTSTTPGEKQ